MHELSIAMRIIDVVEEEVTRHGGRVRAVRLKVGRLSGVDKEALLSAYELAREDTKLSESALVVEEVEVTAYCPACAAEKSIASFPELRCPKCGGTTPQIVHGRELEVVAFEIVEP